MKIFLYKSRKLTESCCYTPLFQNKPLTHRHQWTQKSYKMLAPLHLGGLDIYPLCYHEATTTNLG